MTRGKDLNKVIKLFFDRNHVLPYIAERAHFCLADALTRLRISGKFAYADKKEGPLIYPDRNKKTSSKRKRETNDTYHVASKEDVNREELPISSFHDFAGKEAGETRNMGNNGYEVHQRNSQRIQLDEVYQDFYGASIMIRSPSPPRKRARHETSDKKLLVFADIVSSCSQRSLQKGKDPAGKEGLSQVYSLESRTEAFGNASRGGEEQIMWVPRVSEDSLPFTWQEYFKRKWGNEMNKAFASSTRVFVLCCDRYAPPAKGVHYETHRYRVDDDEKRKRRERIDCIVEAIDWSSPFLPYVAIHPDARDERVACFSPDIYFNDLFANKRFQDALVDKLGDYVRDEYRIPKQGARVIFQSKRPGILGNFCKSSSLDSAPLHCSVSVSSSFFSSSITTPTLSNITVNCNTGGRAEKTAETHNNTIKDEPSEIKEKCEHVYVEYGEGDIGVVVWAERLLLEHYDSKPRAPKPSVCVLSIDFDVCVALLLRCRAFRAICSRLTWDSQSEEYIDIFALYRSIKEKFAMRAQRYGLDFGPTRRVLLIFVFLVSLCGNDYVEKLPGLSSASIWRQVDICPSQFSVQSALLTLEDEKCAIDKLEFKVRVDVAGFQMFAKRCYLDKQFPSSRSFLFSSSTYDMSILPKEPDCLSMEERQFFLSKTKRGSRGMEPPTPCVLEITARNAMWNCNYWEMESRGVAAPSCVLVAKSAKDGCEYSVFGYVLKNKDAPLCLGNVARGLLSVLPEELIRRLPAFPEDFDNES